ncbi:MAG: ATP synthase F1 subunit epsilon [Ignavibacteria bacterium]|nr:ATP synthase F1 subunit epsilon [Ignavibacteria bacterium]
MKEFQVEIVTPAKSKYSGLVLSLTAPGSSGEFQVLYNHAPLISTFEVGKITIKEDESKSEKIFATGGGIIEVLQNKILVLADSLESPEEIDISRAEKALERAKNRLGPEKNKTLNVARAEAAMARAINRLKVAR